MLSGACDNSDEKTTIPRILWIKKPVHSLTIILENTLALSTFWLMLIHEPIQTEVDIMSSVLSRNSKP